MNKFNLIYLALAILPLKYITINYREMYSGYGYGGSAAMEWVRTLCSRL